MDDGSPALEVGFAITPDFSELQVMAEVFNSTEAKVLRGAKEVERATSGMVNLAGATAQVETFGNAHSRVAKDIIADRNRVEKAGERMVAQLERQNATFGKTRDEIRSMRAEEAALAAERTGNTDLALRLRTQEQALWDQQFAAARKARLEAEALAEERDIAAQKAAQAAAAEAQAVRESAQAYQLFEARAREAMQVYRDQQAAQAVVEKEREAQAVRSAGLAYNMFEAAARRGMSAMREQEAVEAAAATEAERLAAAAERLKASIDPAYAAQQRFDAEMGRAKELVGAGAVTLDDYCAKLRVEQALLTRSTSVHQELGNAQRFTAAETLNLSRQFQDIGVTAAMGMNPLMILVQQGPQIFDVLEQARARGVNAAAAMKQLGADAVNFGAAGLSKLLGFLNPVTIGIAAVATTAIVGAASWLSYSNAVERFNALSQGAGSLIGANGAALEASAEAAAAAGNITVGAAREIEVAYVQTGRIGMGILTGLTASTADFAAATNQSAEQAAQALAAAFADPAKGADDLTQKYGLLSAATLDYVHTLVEQGRETEAQGVLLKALQGQFDGAAEHANALVRAWHNISTAASDAWTWMGKAIDRALGGGSAAEKLAGLQAQRSRALRDSYGMADTSDYDAQIATLTKQLEAERSRKARSDAVGGLKVVDSITGDDKLGDLQGKLSAVNKLLVDGGKAAGLNAEQMKNATAARDALTHAVTSYLAPAEKQGRLDALDAQIAAARSPGQKQALAAQRAMVEQAGQVVSATQAQAAASSKGAKAFAEANRSVENAAKSAAKAAANHAAELARDAKAEEAQTGNLFALAAAYGLSGGASLVAEARVKAESKAIKARGDVEAEVARQVRLVIAQRVADGEKAAAALRDQAELQEGVNAAVAAGLVPAAQAGELLKDRAALQPLIAAQQAAITRGDVTGAALAGKAIMDLADAQKQDNAARRDAMALADKAAASNNIDQLRLELQLIGATDAARAHALATLKATQEAQAKHLTGSDASDYIRNQVTIADLEQQRQLRADAFNKSLHYQADLLDILASNVARAGQGMADAFGTAGRALGDLASGVSSYIADQKRLSDAHEEELKSIRDISDAQVRAKREQQENNLYAAKTMGAQITLYGDMAHAARSFFHEGSSGYKALGAVEKAFRVAQMAMSLQAMVQNAAETLGFVAGSAARSAAAGTEGIANQSKLPFPANLIAMAATAAALVAAGVAVFGGGGGGAAAREAYTKGNTGTGTVLGDPDAKSESIKRSIDALKGVDDVTLNVTRDMLTSLRSIDNQIGGLASVLVRSGDIEGASASIQAGFKTDAIGSVLSKIPLIGGFLGGLFGTKTTVLGSGIIGGPDTIGDILANGYDAQTYSDVQKKKKFLGLTVSDKTKTVYGGAVDESVTDQFALILKGFDDAILAAAGPLGANTADITNRLNSFVFSLGKLDFTGLKADEIQQKLEAVFGAAGDNMAQAAIPGLDRFQKVGEGYLETLVRVASTVEQVDASFRRLGFTANSMGVDVDMAVSSLFDSVSDYTKAADEYFTTYYSKEEQAAAKTADLARVFDHLGLTMPDTLASFRALVSAQDLTTDAGRGVYATLLQIAPAFADLQTSLEGAKSAADILAERQDLQMKLLQLTGDTAAIRAAELAKLDPSNRALQQQIYAIQDAQDAAKAAADLRQAWKSVGDSIMDEVRRIRGIIDPTGDSSFASLMGQFNAATASARAGDQDAAKLLPGLSQSLLTAAAAVATSRQELARVQAETAASLEATYGAVMASAYGGSASTAIDAAIAANASQAASSSSAANDDLVAEVRALRGEVALLRTENNAGHASTASVGNRSAKVLENVSNASGGDAISVASAA